eukprot:TRINITY_DN5646_c0_g4_i1.p3 TRINITY_DN5646_c0_g4~~TRINITY_DN5646_c0_g4_i1.p3  ORF type:complete len:151 (+),score=17.56 TRINITY_DN5646_c0_g4_i1:153-605(+)
MPPHGWQAPSGSDAGERAAKARRIGKRDFFNEFEEEDPAQSGCQVSEPGRRSSGRPDEDCGSDDDSGAASAASQHTSGSFVPGQQIILHKGHCRSDKAAQPGDPAEVCAMGSTRSLGRPLARSSEHRESPAKQRSDAQRDSGPVFFDSPR